jgi:ribosome-binding factor A
VLLLKVKDPRLDDITLTGVEVSPDLRHATIFYSLLGDQERKVEAAAGLTSASGYVKRELGKRLKIKRMPELAFSFDASLEYGSHIDRVLSDLKEPDG